MRKTKSETIAAARKIYVRGDDIEIDDNPTLSAGDSGTWVQAWVWVEGGSDQLDGEEDAP